MVDGPVANGTDVLSAPRVAEVAPGVYVATAGMYTTTTTIVAGPDGGCLLVDPAISAADLAGLSAWLAGRGLHAAAGWSTHPHWDHLLWSRALGDAPRYATPRAIAAAARELTALIGQVPASAGHDLTQFAKAEPVLGDEIPWQGPRAMVIAHDGHAPGHGAVFLPACGVLIAGDMCSDIEIPLPDLDSADPLGDYRLGLGLLAAVPGVRVLVPGHGQVGDRAEFRRRIAADFCYLDAVETRLDHPDPGLADPRLGDPSQATDWLRAEHARLRELLGHEDTPAEPAGQD